MGMVELIVALCLQAEPGACRITRTRGMGSLTTCAAMDADGGERPRGWYVARWTCRWRG
ncbi:hypothetical protein [Methylopila sp. Yamaguchi]|uniref:hypothetical protein n=1 Tax=Methylopila sp. Yamaguchi TaxID=1437817 RepID=UPI000CC14E2C|nr:hypothetical protein [Methylopila sp. Yamaguchi]GBD48084.1 hypothetical protein METY_1297 [Methylopila sp. Yamaguchi]